MILSAETMRAQIHGHRLVQRQQLERAAVDVDVHLVEWPVAVQHALDELRVALDERVHGRRHALLGEAAHLEQARLELLELLLEVRYHPFGHSSPSPGA